MQRLNSFRIANSISEKWKQTLIKKRRQFDLLGNAKTGPHLVRSTNA